MSEELEWPLAESTGSSSSYVAGIVDRRTQGDVLMWHEPDGGNIGCVGGIVTLTLGLETATYLSLFGGNEDDSGLADGDREQWWANFEELDKRRHQRSRTQYILGGGEPCTPANLSRVEDAVSADLAWMRTEIGAAIVVAVSITGVNRVAIAVTITIGTTTYRPFKFDAPWGAE